MFYWGDIDEHGFQILHQLRIYYPHTTSMMMNRQTFDSFRNFAVNGQRNQSENLHLLNEDEWELYQFPKSLKSNNRLEQEKIPQWYVDEVVQRLVTPF